MGMEHLEGWMGHIVQFLRVQDRRIDLVDNHRSLMVGEFHFLIYSRIRRKRKLEIYMRNHLDKRRMFLEYKLLVVGIDRR